jgi:hypothetical protein
MMVTVHDVGEGPGDDFCGRVIIPHIGVRRETNTPVSPCCYFPALNVHRRFLCYNTSKYAPPSHTRTHTSIGADQLLTAKLPHPSPLPLKNPTPNFLP